MNDCVRVRYMKMPHGIKGFTVREDVDSYDIFINPTYTYESQMETIEHELSHIKKGDFETDGNIQELEMMR